MQEGAAPARHDLVGAVTAHLDRAAVSHFIASQVALHLVFNWVGRLKQWLFVDKLIPARQMMHFRPERITRQFADLVLTLLAPIIPKSYTSKSKTLHRHSACFGDLLHIPQVSPLTIDLMDELIPQVIVAFLKSVESLARNRRALVLEQAELADLGGLKLPITYVVGEHNNMFVPEATRRTHELLCEKNGPETYQRIVIPAYGHLDCMVGNQANVDVFPRFKAALTGG